MKEKPAISGNHSVSSPDEELPILFFDSDCVFCLRSVDWIIRHDPKQTISFAGLHSNAADRWVPADHPLRNQDTMIFCDSTGLYGQSEAAFRALRPLKTIARALLLFSILPRWSTDPAYRWIANHRHWFGRPDSCKLPDPSTAHRFLD
tara:strand:- start:9674 stop:10117 length:444 start_codon:yes stop_codon:yes gene_type:complete